MAIETSPRFLACLPFVLKEEGGYSNDAYDPGGMTMEGIIQREYDRYRSAHGQPHQWVKNISEDEMHDIYFGEYWLPHCPSLPPGLDLSYFDLCVNGGPMRATVTLQRALGIRDDGQWGPETSTKVANIADVTSIIQNFAAARERFYRSLSTFRYFGVGWIGRTHRCAAASIAMAHAAQVAA
jgi:lysozyme family protein